MRGVGHALRRHCWAGELLGRQGGIIGLTKAATKEVARAEVRVNAIQPGLIATPMTAGMRPDISQRKLDSIPMGRAGDPAEIASVVLFLASDLASYTTGAVLEVAGGRICDPAGQRTVATAGRMSARPGAPDSASQSASDSPAASTCRSAAARAAAASPLLI